MSRFGIALGALLSLVAAAQDEMEDNPEFKAWSKQKPGAWVKWSAETQTGAMKLSTDLTWTLKELTDQKAVIEELTILNVGEDRRQHTGSRTVASKIKKGTTSDGATIEVLKEGDEKITLKGRELTCHWVEMKLTGRQGGTMKVWKTDEIVGGAAKIVIKHDEAAKMTLTMTVVDWKAGGQP